MLPEAGVPHRHRAEVNAELEHAKAISEGLPPDVQPFAEARDTRKLDDEETKAVETAARIRTTDDE